MDEQQPTQEVKREILTTNRDRFRAQGYQFAVQCKIAEMIGDAAQAKDARTKSGQAYQAAKVCDDELAAL